MTGDELLAQGLNKSAQIISQDNSRDAAKDLAQSTAYGFASTQMTNWLNQYGNATIQISSDRAFSGEYFLPFYETEDNLFFSQSRIQRQDEDRTTLNLGLGYRYFMANKMWGINSFYDHDLKNHNARLELGAELGADYIKLAANGYFRLTDWRNSRLSAFHDYDERPANGFDIKAEGFLPSYPQLGANIKYEKYFGDKVNLKGYNSISDLKKDPQAYTVGISYTPVPLLSFSLNQSMGDVKETKGELAVNYRFGVPLSQQLDTDLVQQMRTLTGARYNPVDRNNTIVMQYQKQDLLRIGFEKTSYELNGGKEETINGPIIYKNKYNIKHVVYESINGLFSGDNKRTIESADYSVTFTPPKFNNILRSASNNTYEVNAYAVDVNGNRSNTVKLTVNVVSDEEKPGEETTDGKVDFKKSKFTASFNNGPEESEKLTAIVNGTVTLTVTLKNSDNTPMTGKTVKIFGGDETKIEYKGEIDGVYTFEVTSSKVITYSYRFTVEGQDEISQTVNVGYNQKPVAGKSEVKVEGPDGTSIVKLYEHETATVKVRLRDKNDTAVKLVSVEGFEATWDVDSCSSGDGVVWDYVCDNVIGRFGTQVRARGKNGEVVSGDGRFVIGVVQKSGNDVFFRLGDEFIGWVATTNTPSNNWFVPLASGHRMYDSFNNHYHSVVEGGANYVFAEYKTWASIEIRTKWEDKNTVGRCYLLINDCEIY